MMGRRPLVDHLRVWGLDVVELHKPSRPGEWGRPRALLVHHTGDTCDPDRVGDVVDVVRNGRGGKRPVTGPLAQFALGQDLKVRVVPDPRRGQADPGRANHAGEGAYPRLRIPTDDGNRVTAGVEIQCSGAHPISHHPQLYATAVRLFAALCAWWDLPANAVIGHREYAPDRKIDPRDDMDRFRKDVAAALKAGPGRAPATPQTTQQEDDVQLTDRPTMGPGAKKTLGERDTVGEMLVLAAQGGLAALQTQRTLAEVTGEIAAIRTAVAQLSSGTGAPITEAQIVAAGKAAGEALADRLATALADQG